MDFIDEFIQEYKNNQCLWKTDSENFKNRSKRQEAYIKLIDVAVKHGEYYNIERTKQKINNLRCAFRHQLKKYMEVQSKGLKEEPYCPKRRYFESLMFLKDEENLDRKSSQRVSPECKNQNDTAVAQTKEPHADPKTGEQLTYQSYLRGHCSDEVVQYSNSCKPSSASDEATVPGSDIPVSTDLIPKCPIVEQTYYTSCNAESVAANQKASDSLNMYMQKGKDFEITDKRVSHRKRFLSNSSDHATKPEVVKTPKTASISTDLENLISMLCKTTENCDTFSYFGKIVAHKLRTMEPTQAMLSEKIIADVIFQGQLRQLTLMKINQFFKTTSEGTSENPTQSCTKNNDY